MNWCAAVAAEDRMSGCPSRRFADRDWHMAGSRGRTAGNRTASLLVMVADDFPVLRIPRGLVCWSAPRRFRGPHRTACEIARACVLQLTRAVLGVAPRDRLTTQLRCGKQGLPPQNLPVVITIRGRADDFRCEHRESDIPFDNWHAWCFSPPPFPEVQVVHLIQRWVSFMVSSRCCAGLWVLAMLLACGAGCQRAEPVTWDSSEQVQKLPDELGKIVREAVSRQSGTSLEPRLVGAPTPRDEAGRRRLQQHTALGQAVYNKRCVQCHGVSGDGAGAVAASLYPRPRDYTKGIFKFTSMPYGSKPRRDDLLQTLVRGISGTSMPSFRLLPRKELEAVVDYVILLSRRGELELQLASEAEASEELEAETIDEYVTTVVDRWKEGSGLPTQPLTPQPELTEERVARGREAFLTRGCSKCHGEDGRGHTKDNIGRDAWGFSTRAADLTSGMLRGGQEPLDVYRRIMNGINGTPMPGFRSALESEPDTIWDLVSYVLSVSEQRRLESIAGKATIPAGLIKPYLEPEAGGAGDAGDSAE